MSTCAGLPGARGAEKLQGIQKTAANEIRKIEGPRYGRD